MCIIYNNYNIYKRQYNERNKDQSGKGSGFSYTGSLVQIRTLDTSGSGGAHL